jgi:hypothetical protein
MSAISSLGMSSDLFYQVIGQNNRNILVQSKRLAPFHEDLTKKQPFEPSTVRPGERTRIKLDFKHSLDRELILNDIRLRFKLAFDVSRSDVGKVFCVRATDLIREFTVKINEDIVFKVDKEQELTHLWLMNNHRLGGENSETQQSALLNHGIIPYGDSPPLYYKAADNTWYYSYTPPVTTVTPAVGTVGQAGYVAESTSTTPAVWSDPATGPWTDAGGRLRRSGLERHDGRPRLIYDDTTNYAYQFPFDVSLNHLCGSIFTRFHMRRVEYVQIEIVFEPWLSPEFTQNFLLFKKNPIVDNKVHPYSVARFTDLELIQYRTTLLDGVNGFTLPPSRMLSWLMHRFSRREYTFKPASMVSMDIQLHDWEIRTNIVRVWWMLKPKNAVSNPATENGFNPYAAPCEAYDDFYGVELLWKNDKVLDLETHHDVVRHYTLAENKRHGLNNPHVRFARLMKSSDMLGEEVDSEIVNYRWGIEPSTNLTTTGVPNTGAVGKLHYEVPIYFVDLSMNIHHGVHGSEVIGGIVNDTSDYVVRIKRVVEIPDANPVAGTYQHTETERVLYVWLEYQTLVNLAAGSTQFNRGSQTITKQLNVQN